MTGREGGLRNHEGAGAGDAIQALLGKVRGIAKRPKHAHQPPTELLLVEPSPNEMKILAIIRRVPRGKVVTYGQVARLAGLPGRARFVGWVLARSPLANAVPWHRVISSRGTVSVSGEAEQEQRARLAAEGVRFDKHNRIDLSRYGWCPRHTRDGKRRGKPPTVRSRTRKNLSVDGSK